MPTAVPPHMHLRLLTGSPDPFQAKIAPVFTAYTPRRRPEGCVGVKSPYWGRGRGVVAYGEPVGERIARRQKNKEDRARALTDVRSVAVVMSALLAAIAVYLRYLELDIEVDNLDLDIPAFFSALLLAVAFQYSSPLQLLLVFFGKFETERPVEWVAGKLAQAPNVSKPGPASKAIAAALIGIGGAVTAGAFAKGLGDTYALSTAIGAAFLSFLYEIGRPEQLSDVEAKETEEKRVDFRAFADERLVKVGSCHESEIFEAFVRAYPKYSDLANKRSSKLQMRRFVREWNPYAERTPYGFFKNVAVGQGENSPVDTGPSRTQATPSAELKVDGKGLPVR
ncbi:hypothetical protein AAMO2058_000744900 [Amorphochlora amoebiformis]